jgi:hypothetical protein
MLRTSSLSVARCGLAVEQALNKTSLAELVRDVG